MKIKIQKSMKRIPFLIVAAFVVILSVISISVTGCTGSGQNDKPPQADPPAQKSEKAVQYTCSMHPEVVQDKPGDCPKCGMKLVEKR
jgi:hypothetical protein